MNEQRDALANTQAQPADTILKSPLDGVVTARLQDPGSLANPSQEILELQAMDTAVGGDHRARPGGDETPSWANGVMSPSMSFRDAPSPAPVSYINGAADVQSRLFTVDATLPNTQRRFKPGHVCHRRPVVTARAAG